MIRNTLIVLVLSVTASCRQSAEPMHQSYETLTSFLTRENLYQTLAISDVNVDQLAIVDSKDYRPDNKTLRHRYVEATYDLTVTTRDSATQKREARARMYQAKAAVVSADSVNWRMKSLVIHGKVDSANTVVETTYRWELSGPIGKRTLTRRVTKTEV